LTLITFAGLQSIWPIYLLTAISAGAMAFDTPARQALVPTLVPAADFPNAVSLGIVVFNLATILGPPLAGFVLASNGPAIVYAANGFSFLAVIVALLLMRTPGRVNHEQDAAKGVSFAALREGLTFVRRTPIIVQTMTLDFVATFFAAATALLPIFAAEILHVGARGLGLLAAAPAVGSVVTALGLARAGSIRRQGRAVIISVAIFGAATIAFGLSRVFWLSLVMLAISGAADTVSTVLRQTIRQFATPDKLRGRMTSINMVFFMGGPQLGEVEAGVVAAIISAPISVVVGGIGSVVAAVMAWIKAKSLLEYESENKK
jgi:MFS family permease